MICLHCKNANSTIDPKFAKDGFAKCNHETMTGKSISLTRERECDKFEAVSTDDIQKRDAWNKARGA